MESAQDDPAFGLRPVFAATVFGGETGKPGDLSRNEAYGKRSLNINRLNWYRARLAAMSAPEVAHRVVELVRKRLFSFNRRGWGNFPASDGKITEFPQLRQRLAASWPAAQNGFSQLNAGRFSGLGRAVPETLGPALWHADPIRGGRWPGTERYCFDIDVRATGETQGDVKFVWEINRLQFMHPLASAIAAEPRNDLIERAFGILRSWHQANPPYRGVNWFSGIELAMRMVTLTLLSAAIPPAMLTSENKRIIRQLVEAHGFWLHRYPSRYSSANNHLVAEGLGLFLAGILVPDVPMAGGWAAEGRAILEDEAQKQIYSDGVGAEQSPTYQAFTMEMLAFAALIAAEQGAPFKAVVGERLRAGAKFLQTLMDEAGGVPQIGDDDEGRVIACPPDREPRYVASVTAAVAGLLNDPSLLPPGRDAHIRDAIFAVPADSARAGEGLTQFPEGGYSVAREAVNGRSCVLTFDHGPLGYLSLAAHGHADALGVWLSIDDQPIFVDAGTFLYHSGGAMRTKLRSSLVHNTLNINEVSQSRPSAAFSWASKATTRLDETRPGRWWSIMASHDGYKSRFGTRHRRTITRTPTGFTIADAIERPESALDVELGFLIHPAIEIQRESDRFILLKDGAKIAEILPPVALFSRIVRNAAESGAGLYSPRFGELVAAQRISMTGPMEGDPAITRIDILARP